ncbi:transposase IS701 [Gluconobacter thailandicus F149-1 = NBRC 100600]|uniref:Transposase n=1 Tax=Gluconobacter thailandicus NBRC 3257 TaxID=1381097 RepID=A0ABQ0J1G1_GLUTH|nr:IS701 family transposase [Gluconobacter thailandicus]KXV55032.1 transposase [Gluconobacter thailandicus]GAC88994.1 transposase [Gluconobacter thailandicus NBRC 3255]GAD28317.1 transposase [Gluconobacter thailandicus NBRC 3257]GAN93823.1 transposase IS701 [Gluconobacter thailandicus F149-1 = NBRC 100600]GBR60700.1 transposase [Gluconobacter thailandicus F149-1 = NBRC 100600]
MIQNEMNSTASVEDVLTLTLEALRDTKARMRPVFGQERIAASAGRFLEMLLSNEPRKTGWMRAEAAGDPGPWRQQALLGRARWDADALHDVVRDHVVDHFGDPDAVLVVDETGFLKKGTASCGVSRQYTGSAGKITNCQIGVFATYVSSKGHAFLDRALYLPKSWTDKPERLAAAHVPDGIRFATKPALAIAMIGRVLDANIPFAWVAGDSVYGVGDLEMALRRAGKGFVLGVNANHWFHSWRPDVMWVGEAREIIKTLPDETWVRCSAGHGTKGERWYDWLYCPMANLHASEYSDTLTGTWTRGLLVRRNPADGDLRYFTTWCPQGTPLETLARVEGARWRIEEGFETAKNEFGLDHNETRSWHGWHRHVSLVMLAHAMMAAVRSQANVLTLKKRPLPTRKSLSNGQFRKSGASP